MNRIIKGKFKEITDNRKERISRKKFKGDETVEEVKQVIVSESEEDENENNSTASVDNEVRNSDEDYEKHDSENDEEEINDSKSEEDEIDIKIETEQQKRTRSKKRKRKKAKYDPAEEARLERLVFGDANDVISNLLEKNDEHCERNIPKVIQDSDDSDSDFEIKGNWEDDSDASEGKNKAAWVDEDDKKYSVKTALKQQRRKLPRGRSERVYTELLENKFTQLVGTPKWASLEPSVKGKDEDEDLDNEILKRSTHLAVPSVKKLRKGKIEIKALTDINKSTHTEGPVVSSVEFHPTSTVAMVAGLSGILSLFQVDGRENTKLQSVCFEKFRINCAKFLKEGNEVILGSRNHSYSQAYDLLSGKSYKTPLPHGVTNMQSFEVSPDGKFIAIAGRMGQIHLLSAITKELVADFKMNTKCFALAFSPDSNKLISHGDSDEMYIWDLKNRSCMHKAIDDGCIASSALAFSPSGQFIATGSKQGVVNIYEAASVMEKKNPVPLKIILNLVTPISRLKFNPTSEILAMASKFKENAFKMLHIPSFTVFANFPTFQTKMYNPLDIDFSPSSGYLGLSNNKGHAYLYRLKHYGNY